MAAPVQCSKPLHHRRLAVVVGWELVVSAAILPLLLPGHMWGNDFPTQPVSVASFSLGLVLTGLLSSSSSSSSRLTSMDCLELGGGGCGHHLLCKNACLSFSPASDERSRRPTTAAVEV
uniref:Uncharacterized protein n=1 Tax=Oryza brachyantha TaxID=4533 RepID=J3M4L3_ORYBR